jgi:hypothetical protein
MLERGKLRAYLKKGFDLEGIEEEIVGAGRRIFSLRLWPACKSVFIAKIHHI